MIWPLLDGICNHPESERRNGLDGSLAVAVGIRELALARKGSE